MIQTKLLSCNVLPKSTSLPTYYNRSQSLHLRHSFHNFILPPIQAHSMHYGPHARDDGLNRVTEGPSLCQIKDTPKWHTLASRALGLFLLDSAAPLPGTTGKDSPTIPYRRMLTILGGWWTMALRRDGWYSSWSDCFRGLVEVCVWYEDDEDGRG